jgi:hypothetical protein
MRHLSPILLLALVSPAAPAAPHPGDADRVRVRETGEEVVIETDAIEARVRTKGYVSGVAAGSLLDKKTGARDLGFGLHVMDFLMAPGWRDDGYPRDLKVHGDLPKHYVEGPQICTRARELKPEVVRGKDFAALRLRYTFREPGKGYRAGSTWEQTLVFLPGVRYFLCCERITSANDVDGLFYRIDMPGHLRHKGGDSFVQVYLSYLGRPVPAAAFAEDFGPDAKFLYRRGHDKVPDRMIRAYQVRLRGKPGPWLAGMTLDPADVSEAWCHQRGYVCFIEELHGHRTRAGETIGAAYVVGWFDDVSEMERVYDRYRGKHAIVLRPDGFRLE